MTLKRITKADFAIPMLTRRYARSLAVARALDAKAPLPKSRRHPMTEFETFLGMMTPQRVRLLKIVMKGEQLLTELALAADRDRSAVRRDASALESLGLVVVEATPNPGHGVRTVVPPVAARLEIIGELAP